MASRFSAYTPKPDVYLNGEFVGVMYEGTYLYSEPDFDTGEGQFLYRVCIETSSTAERSDRPSWDEYFLAAARWASTRGECTRRQVGAVVVKNKRVVGTGYNGAPKGAKKTCLTGDCPRSQSGVEPGSSYDTGAGTCIAIHAEANALLDAGRAGTKGSTLYLTTNPCDGCLRLIKAAGIKKVVWPDGVLRKKDLYG